MHRPLAINEKEMQKIKKVMTISIRGIEIVGVFRKKSIWSIAAVVSVVILVIMVAYVIAFSTVTVEGTVDHKTIIGTKDNVEYTLVVFTLGDVDIRDPALEPIFKDNDANITVTQAMEQEMLNLGYSEINYLADIRVISEDPVNHVEPGELLAYSVKRTEFNSLIVGETVSFEVAKMTSATIREVHG